MRAFLVAATLAFSGLAYPQSDIALSYTGSKFPTFKLKTLDGKTISSQKLKGKVYIADFWATWCGPCRRTIPILIEIKKKYKGKAFEVVGMDLSERMPKEGIQKFVSAMGMNYPVALQAESVARQIYAARLPTLYVVDKKGVVRFGESGMMYDPDGSKLSKLVGQLIAER
ncbi:MAG: TlpA family protein disulfide reductase [Armatimonadetes bacterium]|nr:TlpA family protein disulfide reductase [Armatimonadota bacterium]